MCDDDGGTDLVEQIRTGLPPCHVLDIGLARGLGVRCDWRTATAAASPARRGTRAALTSRRGRATRLRLHDVTAALPRDELIEIRRTDMARARPLRRLLLILVRRRRRIRAWRSESPGDVLEHRRARRKTAVQVGMDRRSAVARPIDDVHLEA